MFCVRVLKSMKDGRFYIGLTHDLGRRFAEHNAGYVTATKGRIPFVLVYYEAYGSRSDAVRREKMPELRSKALVSLSSAFQEVSCTTERRGGGKSEHPFGASRRKRRAANDGRERGNRGLSREPLGDERGLDFPKPRESATENTPPESLPRGRKALRGMDEASDVRRTRVRLKTCPPPL